MLSGGAVAQDNPTAMLLEQLKGLETLSGNFKQTQKDSEGELISDAEGEFSMARPGNLYWKTTSPYEQLLVSNGESLWLYDADLEQVTVSPVGERLKNSPAVIFTDDLMTIEQEYLIVHNDNGSYSLRPRQEDSGFQRVDLFFSDKVLSAMQLLDGFGQETHFQFEQVQVNSTLSSERFEFTAPEGADILIHE